MNDYDERLKLPPPEDCMGCARRQTMVTLGVARHWCASGHLMHPGCGFRVPATEGQMHRDGEVMARPVGEIGGGMTRQEHESDRQDAKLLCVRPHRHRELLRLPNELEVGWVVSGNFWGFASCKNGAAFDDLCADLRGKYGNFEIRDLRSNSS